MWVIFFLCFGFVICFSNSYTSAAYFELAASYGELALDENFQLPGIVMPLPAGPLEVRLENAFRAFVGGII